MKKFFREFKEFVSRGNVLNLAVGIIIGGAFGAIITALVNHIIMPPISLLLGDEVSALKWILRAAVPAVMAADGVTIVTPEVKEIAIGWGLFVQAVLNFLIIALVLFIIIKVTTKMHERTEALIAKRVSEEPAPEPEPEPEPSEEVLLLREIRDALSKK
ncbi:MAG: large conductance mechanosensitive channel protein MscL [Bacilli bacterium]